MNASEVLKKILISLADRIFLFIAAWCVQKGVLADDVVSPGNIGILSAGAVAGVIYAGQWWYRKKIQHLVVQMAHDSSAKVPLAEIKAEAKSVALPEVLGGAATN